MSPREAESAAAPGIALGVAGYAFTDLHDPDRLASIDERFCEGVRASGAETIIFSCFNQDQAIDRVDFRNLAARLRQNTVQEKLSNLSVDYLMEEHAVPHV